MSYFNSPVRAPTYIRGQLADVGSANFTQWLCKRPRNSFALDGASSWRQRWQCLSDVVKGFYNLLYANNS